MTFKINLEEPPKIKFKKGIHRISNTLIIVPEDNLEIDKCLKITKSGTYQITWKSWKTDLKK